MRSMTRRLLVVILGLTLLSAVVGRSYAEQGCRGCGVRTAVVIHRALSTQTESGSATSFQGHQSGQITQLMEKYTQEKEKADRLKDVMLVLGLTIDEVVSEVGDVFPSSSMTGKVVSMIGNKLPLSPGVLSIIASGGEILNQIGNC